MSKSDWISERRVGDLVAVQIPCICGYPGMYRDVVEVRIEGKVSRANRLYCSRCGVSLRSPGDDVDGKWLIEHWKTLTARAQAGTGRRPCRDGDKRYLFHGFYQYAYVVGASPMVGGHPGGQIMKVTALVEDESGKMHYVDPTALVFTDVGEDDGEWIEC